MDKRPNWRKERSKGETYRKMKCSVCGKDATCLLKVIWGKEKSERYFGRCNSHIVKEDNIEYCKNCGFPKEAHDCEDWELLPVCDNYNAKEHLEAYP